MNDIIITQYADRKAMNGASISTIQDIFKRIKTSSIDIPKNDRLGNMFNINIPLSERRRMANLTNFTGLMFIDLDDCLDAQKIKELLSSIPVTVGCWFSSSGNIHALVRIPVLDATVYSDEAKDEYHRRFASFGDWLNPRLRGLVSEPKLGGRRKRLFDDSAKDLNRLAFESSDADIYINYGADIYNGINPPALVVSRDASRPVKEFTTDQSWQWFQDDLNQKMGAFYTDGFGNVRTHATWAGNKCRLRNLDNQSCLNFLLNLVNHHPYLNSKNSSGTMDTYLKVAKSGFDTGYYDR